MGAYKWASEHLPDWMVPGRPGDTLQEAATHVLADMPIPGDPGFMSPLPGDPEDWDTPGEVIGNIGGATVRQAGVAVGRAVDVAADGDVDGGFGGIGRWLLPAAAVAVVAFMIMGRR
jgi:hypothetical protein